MLSAGPWEGGQRRNKTSGVGMLHMICGKMQDRV